MPGNPQFAKCIYDQLVKTGVRVAGSVRPVRFGEKRAKALVENFDGLVDGYIAEGRSVADANTLAMKDVFTKLAFEMAEKGKRAAADLVLMSKQGRSFVENNGLRADEVAKAHLEFNPKVKGVTSYRTNFDIEFRTLWAIGNDVLDHMSVGLLGQRGKALEADVLEEIFNSGSTGNTAAKQVATAYGKMTNAGVDRFNAAGGTMNKLEKFHLPQEHNPARMWGKTPAENAAKKKQFVDMHMRVLDWKAMRHPDGSPILPKERADVLSDVFETQSRNGVNKIDPSKYRGNGRAIGNQLENHRFFVYKDAKGWKEAHDTYGDGSVFDVMVRHSNRMAHNIALVRTFGSNPSAGVKHIEMQALTRAKGGRESAAVEAAMKNSFNLMAEVVMRKNPSDPHSVLGSTIEGLSNTLVAAQLGSASLLAIPGDFLTTSMVNAFSKTQGPFSFLGNYLQLMAGAGDKARIAAQAGHVSDSLLTSAYSTQRYTMMATHGPAFTRRLSDATMRLSLLSPHTESMKQANALDFMSLMAATKDKAFSELTYRAILERSGIDEADWNAMRAIPLSTPARGVEYLRPIDALYTGNDALYRKFQGMIYDQGKLQVPIASLESAVMLKGVTRPDTMYGAVLHSFSMYKNMPVTMMLNYTRLAMANPNRWSRVGIIASMAAAMTFVGALGIQMREISQGRDPLPMNTLTFLWRAALAGGALGILGDFLFAGVNRFGQGPTETVAGPLVGSAGDVAQLAFGDAFAWADMSDAAGPNTMARLVEFGRRNVPVVSSLWWSRLAVQRYFFDALAELADPNIYQARQRRAKGRLRDQGNASWWQEGDRSPDRMPNFSNAIR